MRIYPLALTATLLFFFICCSHVPDPKTLLTEIENDLMAGNIKNVILMADSLKKIYPKNSILLQKADSLAQVAGRIALEFLVTDNQIDTQLNKLSGSFTSEQKANWEKQNRLEWRMIDGEKKYFNRAVSNLGLINNFHLYRAARDSLIANDPRILFRRNHTGSIIKESENQAAPSQPVEMVIEYTITVHPDAVPAGEMVRCWLPFPKENHPRQSDVYLLEVSNENFILAPDSAVHRSIYMENKAEKGVPLIFRISYSYKSSGQYFAPANLKALPYNRSSDLFRKYTSEQLPQICFTENIRHIIDSLTGPEENPYTIVKKIYYWFSENIVWANALEYSIMPNITGYVLENRRGDCGMQTFLFMSMLRYKGIPVKWQSGWMVPPDAQNLHDWCEVYFEGTGWVPVDISYGLQYSDNLKTKEFYISGIDSYRLIINDGISAPLYPSKLFMRSEPYDFQRGEVEWRGGNLYFDKWDYNMKIEYKNN